MYLFVDVPPSFQNALVRMSVAENFAEFKARHQKRADPGFLPNLRTYGPWIFHRKNVTFELLAGLQSTILEKTWQNFKRMEKKFQQWLIQDFPVGAHLLFGQFFPENCMKIKKFRPRGVLRVP